MENVHVEILRVIEDKIKNTKDKVELEKFQSLHRLVSNDYRSFFKEIDINIAFNILIDLGFDESEINSIYAKLIKEETKKQYHLFNLNSNKEER